MSGSCSGRGRWRRTREQASMEIERAAHSRSQWQWLGFDGGVTGLLELEPLGIESCVPTLRSELFGEKKL